MGCAPSAASSAIPQDCLAQYIEKLTPVRDPVFSSLPREQKRAAVTFENFSNGIHVKCPGFCFYFW